MYPTSSSAISISMGQKSTMIPRLRQWARLPVAVLRLHLGSHWTRRAIVTPERAGVVIHLGVLSTNGDDLLGAFLMQFMCR